MRRDPNRGYWPDRRCIASIMGALFGHLQRVIQTATGDLHQRISPTLRDASGHGIARLCQPALYAHHFFVLISFITSSSSSRSTSSLRSRAFSASSVLSRLTSSMCLVPNFLRQIEMVASLTPWCLATTATLSLSASRRIRTICSSLYRFFFSCFSLSKKPLSQVTVDPKKPGQVNTKRLWFLG